jgi:hypothetical protein
MLEDNSQKKIVDILTTGGGKERALGLFCGYRFAWTQLDGW